jgi:hypothetical protein
MVAMPDKLNTLRGRRGADGGSRRRSYKIVGKSPYLHSATGQQTSSSPTVYVNIVSALRSFSLLLTVLVVQLLIGLGSPQQVSLIVLGAIYRGICYW